MFGAFAISAIGAMAAAKAEHDAFEAYVKLLPPEEAQKARDRRAAQIEAEHAHEKAMELAEASRPRNWIETLFGK